MLYTLFPIYNKISAY